jgi:EmrB/QacA subfamily drug resistance transporter
MHSDPIPAPRPRTAGWTLLLTSLGAFITALDVCVVATALPVLREKLGASLADLEWTINAYNLAFACLILTGAALGDRFGRRRMYVAGIALFTAGSVASALAGSATELIFSRVAQGCGAAIAVPLSLTLLTHAVPAEKRGAAIGMWGGITGLGVALGPVVGGAIVQGMSWQWIFWLNVPFGVVLMALSPTKLDESHGPRPQLDIPGLGLIGAGMFAVTWGAVRAPSTGWGSAEVLAAFAAGAVLTTAFLAWERRTPKAMLPLPYFRIRGFSTANAIVFFLFFSILGALFLMTQLFQIGFGYSPLGAGLRILAWMAMPMLVAPIAGALADRFGNRPFLMAGLTLQAGGLIWLSRLVEPGVGYGSLVVPLIVSGVGVSMCLPTVSNAVMAAVPAEDVGVASGTNGALRELGGVFGIAIAAAVFARNGSYASPAAYIHGFKPAIATIGLVAVLGVIAAALAPGRSTTQDQIIADPEGAATVLVGDAS